MQPLATSQIVFIISKTVPVLQMQHRVAFLCTVCGGNEDLFYPMFSANYLVFTITFTSWHITCICRPTMTVERNQIAPSDFILRLTRGTEPRRILCWVGSADKQDWVVKVSDSLSKVCRGQCVTVMCLDSPSLLEGVGTASKKPAKKPLTPEVIGQAGTRLSTLYGNDIQTMVLPGHPIAEIRRYARTRNIDLIVMGEQALAIEKAYGERLLDDAPCMVMVLAFPKPEENPSTNRPANTKSGQVHSR
jgi:nucleotide-binding universal stress UspA family protein